MVQLSVGINLLDLIHIPLASSPDRLQTLIQTHVYPLFLNPWWGEASNTIHTVTAIVTKVCRTRSSLTKYNLTRALFTVNRSVVFFQKNAPLFFHLFLTNAAVIDLMSRGIFNSNLKQLFTLVYFTYVLLSVYATYMF